jgi:hypothetical protein
MAQSVSITRRSLVAGLALSAALVAIFAPLNTLPVATATRRGIIPDGSPFG